MAWWDSRRRSESSRPAPAATPAENAALKGAAADALAAAAMAPALALAGGDCEEALWAAQAALAAEPEPANPWLLCYLAQGCLRTGRLAEARHALERLRAGGDPYAVAAAWLPAVERALAAQQALPRVNARAAQLESTARAALAAGNYAEAVTAARQAVAADPDNLLAHHLLCRALLAAGQTAEARAAYDAARAQDATLSVVTESWLEPPAPDGTPEVDID